MIAHAAIFAQAVSKDGKSAHRLLVIVRLLESGTGSLQPLLALRTLSTGDGGHGVHKLLEDKHQESDSEEDGDEDAAQKRSESPDLHDRLDSRCVQGFSCLAVYSYAACLDCILQCPLSAKHVALMCC